MTSAEGDSGRVARRRAILTAATAMIAASGMSAITNSAGSMWPSLTQRHPRSLRRCRLKIALKLRATRPPAQESWTTDPCEALRRNVVVYTRFAIFIAVHPLPGARVEEPVKQRWTANSERILKILARPGTVTVDGNREGMDAQSRHGLPLWVVRDDVMGALQALVRRPRRTPVDSRRLAPARRTRSALAGGGRRESGTQTLDALPRCPIPR